MVFFIDIALFSGGVFNIVLLSKIPSLSCQLPVPPYIPTPLLRAAQAQSP